MILQNVARIDIAFSLCTATESSDIDVIQLLEE